MLRLRSGRGSRGAPRVWRRFSRHWRRVLRVQCCWCCVSNRQICSGLGGWWFEPRLLARFLLNRGLLSSTTLSEPPCHTEHRPLSHIDELARNWSAGCRKTWRWDGRAAAILCSVRVSSEANDSVSRTLPVCPAAVTAGVVLTAACSSLLACGLAWDKLEAQSGGCTTIAPPVSAEFLAQTLLSISRQHPAEQLEHDNWTLRRTASSCPGIAEARKVIEVFLR